MPFHGGKTAHLLAGAIRAALAAAAGLPCKAVGRFDIFAARSYVAVARAQADKALQRLEAGKIKGRRFRVRRL